MKCCYIEDGIQCDNEATHGIYPQEPYSETYACGKHVEEMTNENDVVREV